MIGSGAPRFSVITGEQVHRTLVGREKVIVDLVESLYLMHGAGNTVNPPSYFLRFPDKPSSRIIALPAALGGGRPVDGIKWISSFPGNVGSGLPRASAVLVLNDHETGYPFACLESSIISAVRTAASAALAADVLTRRTGRPARIGFVGTGLIARYVETYLAATGWAPDEIGVHDLSAAHAGAFRDYLGRRGRTATVTVHDGAESLIRGSDLVVFATVAGEPHVVDPGWFDHNPVVLHLSLRDLSPEVVLAATNVVDDVEHCLKADTSPHLAEQRVGHRRFVDATLPELLEGAVELRQDRPVVFSPFGLGVLDLGVALHVHDELSAAGELFDVPDFFYDLDRYGRA